MSYHGNRRASDRDFPPSSVMIGGVRTTIKKVRCAGAGCTNEAEVIDRTRQGMAPDVTTRKFTQKGWEIGANEKHDFCPTCVSAQTAERRLRRNKAVNLKLVEPSQTEEAPMSTAEETAPTPMGRDDRRVIFTKLNEVYLDEARGYEAPWTDKKVADHLGTPIAWVVDVRDRDFGPARDNSEIRDMLDRIRQISAEVENQMAHAKAIRAEGAALVERINANNHAMVDLKKRLDGLLATADRIEQVSC